MKKKSTKSVGSRKSPKAGTGKRKSVRPPKGYPYKEFPLSPHASGKWQKKIKGKIHYFGNWGRVVNGKLTPVPDYGWKEAHELYQAQAADLHAGRTPRNKPGQAPTVADVCNEFYEAKVKTQKAGEITARTLDEYDATCERLTKTFGRTRLVDDLSVSDFASLREELAAQYGPVRLGNEVQRVRTVFKWAFENEVIDHPVRFGSDFKKPSKTVMRKHKADGGKKAFTADEIQRILKAASPQVKAMILLGINCAFGNTDVGTLKVSDVDLKSGWHDFPRGKTGVERRCPLWPETIRAIKAAIKERPEPKDKKHADLIFVTKYGHPWVQGGPSNAISPEVLKLLRPLKINGRRGLGFYSLRHTFRTVADGSKDVPAARHIMGHLDSSIDATYTHSIEDDRLQAVADHVHAWLFASTKKTAKKTGAKKISRKVTGKRPKRG